MFEFRYPLRNDKAQSEHSSDNRGQVFAGSIHEVRHEGLRIPEVTSVNMIAYLPKVSFISALLSWCCRNKKHGGTGLTTRYGDQASCWTCVWEIEYREVWSNNNFLTRNRVDSCRADVVYAWQVPLHWPFFRDSLMSLFTHTLYLCFWAGSKQTDLNQALVIICNKLWSCVPHFIQLKWTCPLLRRWLTSSDPPRPSALILEIWSSCFQSQGAANDQGNSNPEKTRHESEQHQILFQDSKPSTWWSSVSYLTMCLQST